MKTESCFVTSLTISVILLGAAAGKTVYVDADAPGVNNGSSWPNAYRCLQDALAAASSGDQILVAQGIYKPDEGQGITPGDRSVSFRMISGSAVLGGYAGCNAPNPDARDIHNCETILSGDLAGDDIEVTDPAELLSEPTRRENSSSVVDASGCDRTTLLEGLTITAGSATFQMLNGGGIRNGKPTIMRCKIVANSSSTAGGGMYFNPDGHSQAALLKDSIISHNAANTGGGVYGCVEASNCTFTDNVSLDGPGGALYVGSSCETTVANCIFSRNYAATDAGVAYLGSSGTQVTFTNCSFIANSSGARGGVIFSDGCTCGSYPTFYQCSFIGNTAAGNGGAICNYGFTDTQLYSCLLIGNRSGENGGALCDEYDGGSALINCTVSNNTAAGQGGGVCYNHYSYKGHRLANTIIWANSDKNGQTHPYSQIHLIEVSELQTVTHCCFQVIPPEIKGQGNITSNPLFVDIDGADNVPGNEDDDLHLLDTSACIDTGHNEYASQQASDLDGKPRIVNGTVDRGAYEYARQQPRIIYVDAGAAGMNDGASWKDAFKYLQVGILAASSGDEIRVAQGIYKPNEGVVWDTPDDRLITFQLKNGVTIKGGYAGYGRPNPDSRNIEIYQTILSGDLRGNDVDVSDPCFLPSEPSRTDNNYHVVTSSGTDETAVIDGFTITGGHAMESGGGGMCNILGSPTVKSCTFLKNSAYAIESGAQGGAIYNEYGSPTISECNFISNAVGVGIPDHGSGNGGAIADTHSSPKVISCTFIRNVAMGNNGGAVYHSDGSAELTNCTFERNTSRIFGGGTCNWSGDLRMTGCTFVRNSSAGGGGLYNSFDGSSITGCTFTENAGSGFGGGARDDGGGTFSGCTFGSNLSGVRGGGMYISAGSPTVTGCKFVRNISGDGGGGVYIESDGSPLINDCVFSENSIYDGSGGGVWNHGNAELAGCRFTSNSALGCIGGGMSNEGDSTLTNCIFAGNSSEYGAGMSSGSGTATLINCLLNGNLATNWGGGLCSVGSLVSLVNCTLVANSSPLGSGLACRSPTNVPDSIVTISNCIFSDQNGEIWNNDNSTITITFSDIQGGWPGQGNINTNPLFVDPSAGNCRLLLNSPCIDTGDSSALPPSITADLEGRARIVGDKVDMGAYEFYMLYVDDDAPGDPAPRDPKVSDPLELGSEARPFDSVQEAIDMAKDGYVVVVRPGSYLSLDPWVYDDLEFRGKNITLTSADPNDPEVVNKTVLGGTILFDGTEDSNCMLTGFKIHSLGYGAVYGGHTRAAISHCVISGNGPCAGTVLKDWGGTVSNCLITDNTTFSLCGIYPVVFGCNGLIRNCTIANNIGGISVGTATIENCIIYNNAGSQLAVGKADTLTVLYSDIQRGLEGIVGGGKVVWGPGNIDVDPCFVRPGYWTKQPPILTEGDYHLKSEGWRWNAEGQSWTYDQLTSRCIDAGNPGLPLGDEPLAVPRDPKGIWGENRRINMGAYGGTKQASLAPRYAGGLGGPPPPDMGTGGGWALLADLNNDGRVDCADLADQAEGWLQCSTGQPGDLNHDGKVDGLDFATLADSWLKTTMWAE